jgi:ankyrin repeat protein
MRYVLLFIAAGNAFIGAACLGPPRAGSPLAEAAGHNDAETVATLLADTPRDAVALHWPLTWAARNGAIDAMAVLIDAGAGVNERDDDRRAWTPLHHAIHKQQVNAVQLLLERGADPNAADHPGALTPLLMAVIDADPAITKLLLAYGADPHIAGEWGDTPLIRAVDGGALSDIDRPLLGGCHVETVRALMAYDPTLRLPRDFPGHTARWWARFHGCDEVLKLVR